MTYERNAKGLRQKAQEKKQEALSRTNQAINRLVKEGKKINFHTVAEAAGVSVPYLYKQDAIKERIDHLRKQQSPIKGLPSKETVSDDSKKAIVITLKKRVRDLEAENRGLRDHIEVIQGIVLEISDLKQQIEVLKEENSKLKDQLDECRRHHSEPGQSDEPKVSSLLKKRHSKTDISDHIKIKLDALGIKLNSTLSKKIQAASVEVVLAAIEALFQAMEEGEVKSPGGWLASAIEDGWTKNKPQLQQASTYKPTVYKAPEESEEELINSEQIHELWKGFK